MYSRISNPTVAVFGSACVLEGAPAAVATASGQAAPYRPSPRLWARGRNIVAPHALRRIANLLTLHLCRASGIETTFVNGRDPDAWRRSAIRPNTRLLFGETVGNPGSMCWTFRSSRTSPMPRNRH